ncbi:MAG: 50S ribosomal protein L29, partial [Clostridia bacterium]|nr:50S ribosomal protein L29 [Clostridia bacterium]
MKSTKFVKDLREMSAEELNAKLKELKEELFTLRFQHAINQLDNPQKIVEVKKNIARVMTVLSEKNAEGGKVMTEERNLRKTRVGRVVSDKMNKTVVIA